MFWVITNIMRTSCCSFNSKIIKETPALHLTPYFLYQFPFRSLPGMHTRPCDFFCSYLLRCVWVEPLALTLCKVSRLGRKVFESTLHTLLKMLLLSSWFAFLVLFLAWFISLGLETCFFIGIENPKSQGLSPRVQSVCVTRAVSWIIYVNDFLC